MGYYATMDGSITLRKPIAQETILERIGDFAYENEPEVTDYVVQINLENKGIKPGRRRKG